MKRRVVLGYIVVLMLLGACNSLADESLTPSDNATATIDNATTSTSSTSTSTIPSTADIIIESDSTTTTLKTCMTQDDCPEGYICRRPLMGDESAVAEPPKGDAGAGICLPLPVSTTTDTTSTTETSTTETTTTNPPPAQSHPDNGGGTYHDGTWRFGGTKEVQTTTTQPPATTTLPMIKITTTIQTVSERKQEPAKSQDLPTTTTPPLETIPTTQTTTPPPVNPSEKQESPKKSQDIPWTIPTAAAALGTLIILKNLRKGGYETKPSLSDPMKK